MSKVLLKDVIIPKGTILEEAPTKIEMFGGDHYEAIIGLTKDSYGHFLYCMDRDDADLEEWFADVK